MSTSNTSLSPAQPISISPDWKVQLSQAVTSIDQLLSCLDLSPEQLSASQQAASEFALKVPRPFIQRMQPGDPRDPLLLQVLPVTAEMQPSPDYNKDPLEESKHNPIAGIVHKYANRLLLVISPACAINCRYCFRRHFPYAENRQSKQQWQSALDYIRSDMSINEVIYSGGDPLAANDSFLGWLTAEIAEIAHIKRLRIHTRLPLVIPARIDQSFLKWATATRLKPIVVLHINHANEIDAEVAGAIKKLLDAGMQVLNQSVLLRGVNDSALALAELSERLFDCGVSPYYLHLCDPVAGAQHFDLDETTAKQIYGQLQTLLPGFLVPKLVREIPNRQSKTLIS
ncbi:MAG: EF-P beta-lysylation protein EpmB [Porticoccaceae bacterium]|jgi:EF-P beta-lysylation protein EpmB|nr:EF-P beta-lysylation protein EpmB [Porticoccaceae bacterium]